MLDLNIVFPSSWFENLNRFLKLRKLFIFRPLILNIPMLGFCMYLGVRARSQN